MDAFLWRRILAQVVRTQIDLFAACLCRSLVPHVNKNAEHFLDPRVMRIGLPSLQSLSSILREFGESSPEATVQLPDGVSPLFIKHTPQ